MKREMTRSALAGGILLMSRIGRLRGRSLRLAMRFEGGPFYSATAREIMSSRYGVVIGEYSYGGCFEPGAFPPGTRIGRYVSVAGGVTAFGRNHPMDRLTMHPFFYNEGLGLVETDTISSGSLSVGHDVWIGSRAIITPGCARIGFGSVVGAGSVVTHDVPEFSVIAGNPARVIRKRFPDAVCCRILESHWWEKDIADLNAYQKMLCAPLRDAEWLTSLSR